MDQVDRMDLAVPVDLAALSDQVTIPQLTFYVWNLILNISIYLNTLDMFLML